MKEKVRQSNFELMRLISMFFIVLYHMIIITGGDLIHHTSGMTNVILDFISLFIIVHVNSFILITGYFQCKQEFSFKKILSLIGSSLKYNDPFSAITFSFIVLLYISFSVLVKIKLQTFCVNVILLIEI